MSKTNSKFRFKQFAVSHHRSSMKVGVDGVLIGCWTDVKDANRILDVGTGCGLIALIMAQRAPDALIHAIDIDAPSIEEAIENIAESPWADRIKAFKCRFMDFADLVNGHEERFDLIVSNPPYFDSGVTEIMTAREKARHQGELSPTVILEKASEILTEGGSVAMVVPSEMTETLNTTAASLGYFLVRSCRVRGHEQAPYKRTLFQWRLGIGGRRSYESIPDTLTLEVSPGIPTDDYRSLCKDFYLKF